jgi:hypothetical protein
VPVGVIGTGEFARILCTGASLQDDQYAAAAPGRLWPMTDAEREAFIEGAMWARAELSANLSEEELEELIERGLMPHADPFRESARDAYERRARDD